MRSPVQRRAVVDAWSANGLETAGDMRMYKMRIGEKVRKSKTKTENSANASHILVRIQ